jgi:hypothetical protein
MNNTEKFRRSKFPGNMYNYIWCPYYLPSFMKFCSVVSEELRWQTVWRTDGQTTGQKQYVSPQKWGETLKQLVSTTPLKLQNRISWNLVGSKDTICSCAYYQEILISWILWFGWWVSEEKIKMWKVNRWQTTHDGHQVMPRPTLPLARWAKKNIKMWIPTYYLAKLTKTWQEASMACPLWRLLISSRSVNKHGHHRPFLFLIGRYLKSLLLWSFRGGDLMCTL